jgi:hypothetical protein
VATGMIRIQLSTMRFIDGTVAWDVGGTSKPRHSFGHCDVPGVGEYLP